MNSRCFFIGTTLADHPVAHHFIALANELSARGHQVVILAPHRKVELENHETNPAIYTWPSERPTQLRDALFLHRLVRKYRPACLISNFVAVNVMTVGGCLARVFERVAWYHTTSEQLAQDSRQPKWKQTVLRTRKRLVYAAATRVVANSAASAEDLQRAYAVPKRKCSVFHNSLADPLRDGRFKNDSPEQKNLVCVGRIFPSKGQDVLIRALAILKKRSCSVHVEFVGEGPAQKSCEQLARELGVRDHCTFAGQMNHDAVLRKMCEAIATVVPSRNEAFGLVNIESMAVGTPVVASGVGGMVEVIRDGLDGFLVPPDNPEMLAEKLQTLISNPELRRKMGCQARQRFLTHFELHAAISKQADWFESMLEGQPNADLLSAGLKATPQMLKNL